MSKTFRPWTIDQPLLLPPSVQDFVGEDHLARFILALVLEPLDLGEIEAAYASERGQPPFDPAMMTALLLYGYCNGVYSSRRIAKAARERVDFLSIVGLDPPDFRTVSDFRKRHLKALAGLFGQVLKLCEQAGLVKLGHVALDGTKIKANASKHKAMSYERMEKRAAELEAEVERWLSAAEAADAEEDRAFAIGGRLRHRKIGDVGHMPIRINLYPRHGVRLPSLVRRISPFAIVINPFLHTPYPQSWDRRHCLRVRDGL